MRWLAVLVLAAACTPDDVEPAVVPDDLAVDWTGRFEGNGTCLDGEVTLSLQPAGDGWFTGTYDYVSPRPEGDIVATYTVGGEIVDGALFVEQEALADVNAPELHWCFGEIALAVDPFSDGAGMAGSWVPGNCACDGAVFVAPVE